MFIRQLSVINQTNRDDATIYFLLLNEMYIFIMKEQQYIESMKTIIDHRTVEYDSYFIHEYLSLTGWEIL